MASARRDGEGPYRCSAVVHGMQLRRPLWPIM